MEPAKNFAVTPSTSARPDLDWSQVRETIMMLNLAVAQIEMALKESSGSVEILTDSFTGMYGNLMVLVKAAHELPESSVKHSIEETGVVVSSQMQQAIVAFQFYDRLSQRLSHACRSLDELTAIVNDPSRLYNPFSWHTLQQHIRSKYTMEDEKLMFDKLLETGNVQAALSEYVSLKQEQAGETSDIELF
jgi:hypothetical protein